MDKAQARELLKQRDLRVTSPRLAVMLVLAAAHEPLSHGEVVARLGETDWDPATIYRNLIKLRDTGIAPVVSKAGGVDRYALASPANQAHRHPHFVCEDCGRVACLPEGFSVSVGEEDRWSASIRTAMVQLSGECPDCIEARDAP